MANVLSHLFPLDRETVLVVAHGTSLRGLVKHLEGISDTDICALDLPNGIPIVYQLDEELRVVGRRFLADPDTVRRAVERVANISKKPEDTEEAHNLKEANKAMDSHKDKKTSKAGGAHRMDELETSRGK